MKKIAILFLIISLAYFSIGQQTTTDALTVKADYLKKSKTQKTVGTVLVLTGSALIVMGIIVGAAKNDQHTQDYTGGYILLGGISAAIISIPFFIASGKNKKRAAAVSFKNEKIPQLYKGSVINHSVLSVKLSVSL